MNRDISHPLHERLWPTLREREETLGWFGCSRVDVGLHVLSGTAHVTVLERPKPLPVAERVEPDRREQLARRQRIETRGARALARRRAADARRALDAAYRALAEPRRSPEWKAAYQRHLERIRSHVMEQQFSQREQRAAVLSTEFADLEQRARASLYGDADGDERDRREGAR